MNNEIEPMDHSFFDNIFVKLVTTFGGICGLIFLTVYLVEPHRVGSPYETTAVIKEISFRPQHQEEHCSKGCYNVTVPDTWWLNVCIPEIKFCESFRIIHAPWGWMTSGSHVTATLQNYSHNTLNIESIAEIK